MSITSETANLIEKYLRLRKDKCQALVVAFNTFNPYIVSAWPLTERHMQRIVSFTAKEVGITKKVSPIIFRNTLLVKLLKENIKVKKIRELLGDKPGSPNYQRFLHFVKNRKKSSGR